MSEQNIMKDILSTEKSMVVNTAMAMNEASSNNVYNAYSKIFDDLTKEVKELFTICYNKNWYQLTEADTNQINQTVTKLCGELNSEGE